MIAPSFVSMGLLRAPTLLNKLDKDLFKTETDRAKDSEEEMRIASENSPAPAQVGDEEVAKQKNSCRVTLGRLCGKHFAKARRSSGA